MARKNARKKRRRDISIKQNGTQYPCTRCGMDASGGYIRNNRVVCRSCAEWLDILADTEGGD